ncbi:hypothetical protein [Mycolicibacterium litorale]|uniref:Uncharacterized protein n=2 Tax=Mycolicibacterium litorale TaxID=758802 RepID=A0AAD1II80_9MYCO|nr:hypothetical protein [Mycolicibacterium litorale]MCV7418806.1 hypothetical protein [Mycolicibacterium litorale]BBY15754.1 hypothetical protein MLIT_13460 [Mycolicibacterium litorale]
MVDMTLSEVTAQLDGYASEGEFKSDAQFVVRLPFGQAIYEFGSLTALAPKIYVPRIVFVDFSADVNAPLRRLKIEIVDGVPQCVEIRVAARPGGRGLRSIDLDAIDVAGWVEDIMTECIWHEGPDGRRLPRAGLADGRKAVRAAQRAGHRTVTPELLAEVARIYRANVDGKPIKAISAEFGLGERTAARYVQMCRSDKYGLLPKTERGKRRA